MAVATINLQDAIRIARASQYVESQITTNFFDVFGTAGCLLNCEAERTLNENFPLNTYAPQSKRDKKRVMIARRQYNHQYLESRKNWFTADEIAKSVEQGCGSCSVFRQIIYHLFSESQHKFFTTRGRGFYRVLSQTIQHLFPAKHQSLSSNHEYSISQNFELQRRLVGEKGPVEVIQLFRPSVLGVQFERLKKSDFLCNKEVSIARLRQWMNECLSSHRSCSAQTSVQNDKTRPARLLDVSGRFRSRIRIIETETGTSYQYACLSHRWDKAVIDHVTTTDNLPSRLSSLALRKLPLNFRDAVSIARGLDIKYLWIDSICIIQAGDNDADLNRELAKMGFIYQNAYLTIVAVSSSDSSGGCFPRPASDVCFSVSNNTKKTYLIGARVLDKEGHAVSIDKINAHYPLLTRGWVFQEVLLSPRTVLCNYGEFTFECYSSSRCECNSSIAPHPARAQTSTWLGHLNFVDRQRLRPLETVVPQDAFDAYRDQVMNFWRNAVHKYSQLELTYSKDVLSAIGGCAQVLESNLQYTYIAGMWKEILHLDMLWYIDPQKRYNPKPRSKDTTAPSWSWASVSMGQTITHIVGKGRYLLRDAIKEHHHQPKILANPYGDMAYAYLKLDAKLYPWYLRIFCLTSQHHWRTQHPPVNLFINRPHDSRNCTASVQELILDNVGIQTFLDEYWRDEALVFTDFSNCAHPNPARQCGLAQIYLLHAKHGETKAGITETFLALKRTQSRPGKPNCYRRIGFVILSDGGKGTPLRTWDTMIQGHITSQREEFWLF